jgi:hypothetical protein
MQGELQARQANLQLDKDAKATAENLKKQEKVNQSDEAGELSEDDSTINNKEKKRDQPRKSKTANPSKTNSGTSDAVKTSHTKSNHKVDFTA